MDSQLNRASAIAAIAANITRHGHHIYVVSGAPLPRFAYTIGLHDTIGSELIFAGGVLFMKDEVMRILNEIAQRMTSDLSVRDVAIDALGRFSLRPAHSTWSSAVLLGAIDFYQIDEVPTFQVVPDSDHMTIDVPPMHLRWNPETATAWRWLIEPWSLPVPETSNAVTNLAALRGEPVTEVARWEVDEWEAFSGSGPDTPKEEVRVVPIGTLLGFDPSLNAMIALNVNEAIWRDTESDWQPWNRRNK